MDPIDRDDPEALSALRPPPAPASARERVLAGLDSLGISPARAMVWAVAIVAVLVAGALWLLRPTPVPVDATLPLATPETGPASTATSAPTTVVVHVAGAVKRPGVLELDAGSRVVDAIEAAGGVATGADLARLNLAAPLVDGSQIYVPTEGEPVPEGAAAQGGPDGGSAPAGPVNLNTATLEQLDSLPGVGPATAQAIIDWREAHGGFASVDDLLDVRGIGEAKLADLRDLVTV